MQTSTNTITQIQNQMQTTPRVSSFFQPQHHEESSKEWPNWPTYQSLAKATEKKVRPPNESSCPQNKNGKKKHTHTTKTREKKIQRKKTHKKNINKAKNTHKKNKNPKTRSVWRKRRERPSCSIKQGLHGGGAGGLAREKPNGRRVVPFFLATGGSPRRFFRPEDVFESFSGVKNVGIGRIGICEMIAPQKLWITASPETRRHWYSKS